MTRPLMRDVLLKIGFQEDTSVVSDPPGGLSPKCGDMEPKLQIEDSDPGYRKVSTFTKIVVVEGE